MLPINPENEYSEEQLLAAQLLADRDTTGMTIAKIAEVCQVSERTLYRWMRDPEFINLMNEQVELVQKAFLGEAYLHLRKAVRGGSTRALELYLKNQGKLIDKKEVAGQIDVVATAANMDADALKADIEELKRRIEEQQKKALPEGIVIDAKIVGEDE